MASIERLVLTSELKMSRLASAAAQGNIQRIASFRYHDMVDTATILLIPAQEGLIVHYLDDHVAFLYEENSLEVVGFRIEAFEKSFLPANENVRRLWTSDAIKDLRDFGQIAVMFEQVQPKVVREVIKANERTLKLPRATLKALVEV